MNWDAALPITILVIGIYSLGSGVLTGKVYLPGQGDVSLNGRPAAYLTGCAFWVFLIAMNLLLTFKF